jgi:hypothetical protein
MNPSEKRRLAAERAQQVALRAEKRARQDQEAYGVPVTIEIMTCAQMFAHPHGLVLYRMMKRVSDPYDCCNLCEKALQSADTAGFAFARRRPNWDEDLWVMWICHACFAKSDLVERVRAYVATGLDWDHVIVSCRLIGAANE